MDVGGGSDRQVKSPAPRLAILGGILLRADQHRGVKQNRLAVLLPLVLLTAIVTTLSLSAAAEAAPLSLLDGRGWEMVSPVDKNGGEVQGFGANAGGDVLQAAADGNSFSFSSSASFGAEAEGAPVASQYISHRGGGAWATQNITLPTLSGAYGEGPDGVPYQLFSPDLARAVVFDGRHCDQGQACLRSYSLREEGAGLTRSPEAPDLTLAGASPDLRHVVLSTCAALTADATEVAGSEGCEPADRNLYEWSNGQLELINVEPGETHGTPFASLGAQSGAVSADGSRVYWTLPGGPLYLREGGSSRQLDEAPAGEFQTATPDGSVAFFIENEHLYRYDAETGKSTYFFLAPITMGAGNGGLLGLVGVSNDGSYIYYVGVNGNLYLRHEGEDTNIASAVEPGSYPPSTGTARVSADGTRLLFLSKVSLTGYDNTDASSGEPDSELYLFDAAADGGAGSLRCLSCNPSGERPIGPSTIPGAIANGEGPGAIQAYKPRVLTDGARRVFFDSEDALVPQDTDNRPDVYEWEEGGTGSCSEAGGCLQLISSGRSAGGASFADASASGSDAFFLTDGSLVPSDPGSVDLYDARENGGFPLAAKPIPCEGDACQPLPSPPEDPSPGTLVTGAGNPALRFGSSGAGGRKPGGKKPGHGKAHRGKHHKRHGGSRRRAAHR
jgi:hypothetical protein